MKRKINGKRQRKQRVSIPSSTFKRAAVQCVPKKHPYVDLNGVEWDSLTICVADGLDASMDGRGFDGGHLGATRLADAAPKLLAACMAMLRDSHHHGEALHTRPVGDQARAAIREAYTGAVKAAGVEADPQTLPGLLAEKFSELLRKELGEKRLKEVCGRNLLETEPGVCHSHDFTDANQIMLDAEKALGLPEGHDDTRTRLVNEAWNMAKRASFYRGWPTPKAQPVALSNNRIIVVIEGGLVQDVLTEQPAQYRVIDYDFEGADVDEIMDVGPATGEANRAIKSRILKTEQNPDRVAAFFNLPTP